MLRLAARRVRASLIAQRSASSSSAAAASDPASSAALDPEAFFDLLHSRDIDFFAGVPDSLLKDFCGFVSDNAGAKGISHTITANEGSAISMAAGHHFATGSLPLVYMQNSGLGNAVNPLLSLADPRVYAVPMVMLIGWRGQPGVKDEPQHVVQGDRMETMLESMGVPYEVLPSDFEEAEAVVAGLCDSARERSGPVALLARKGVFGKYKMKNPVVSDAPLTREDSLRLCIAKLGEEEAVVSTTGFASREVFELREELGQLHNRDFLTVGSMGHASAIALGIAEAQPERRVVCFDGDGAMVMQMGNMATVGMSGRSNVKHVIHNNLAHDSVGAQPTGIADLDVPAVAKAMGYSWAARADSAEDLESRFAELMAHDQGPGLLEVRCRPGARSDLGRPTTTPVQNKDAYMAFLKDGK